MVVAVVVTVAAGDVNAVDFAYEEALTAEDGADDHINSKYLVQHPREWEVVASVSGVVVADTDY